MGRLADPAAARRSRRAPSALAAALLAVVSTATAGPARADLETDVDEAIHQACHGWVMAEAFDSLAELAGLERSPLCDPDLEPDPDASPSAPAAMEDRPRRGLPIDLGPRHEPNLQIEIECEMEYMCVQERVKARDRGHPISLKDYQRVEEHCEQSYGCLEAWFEDWPRPLPEPRRLAEAGQAATERADAADTPSSPAAPAEDAPPEEEEAPAALAAPGVPVAPIAPIAPAAPAAPGPGSLAPRASAETLGGGGPAYAVSLEPEGRTGDTLLVRYAYGNHSPVPLHIGPTLVRVRCSDGTDEPHGLGPSLDLGPGSDRDGTWSPDAETAERMCRDRSIAGFAPEPVPPVHQPGIGGPREQALVCSDGRRVHPVVRMADDGETFVFGSSRGGSLVLKRDDYDARRIAAAFCGGALSDYGDEPQWVAVGRAYLSRDFHRYVAEWSDACRRDRPDCLALYRSFNPR